MEQEPDAVYYERRSQAARTHAVNAGDPLVSRIHHELAERYARAAQAAALSGEYSSGTPA